MIVYLAGKPADHEPFNQYAKELTADGYQVVSTWHRDAGVAQIVAQSQQQQQANSHMMAHLQRILETGPDPDTDENPFDSLVVPVYPFLGTEEAEDRFRSELKSADYVIADLESSSMEAGYALALGKKVIAIGSSESMMIPFFLGQVKIVNDWPSARAKLFSARSMRVLGRKFPIEENA